MILRNKKGEFSIKFTGDIMLGKTFSVMIIISFVCALMTGNIERMSTQAVESLSDAVGLCISLMGMMCFWNGIMNVLKESGIVVCLSTFLRPLVNLIYGKKNITDSILLSVSSSMCANFLGLGNAALPLGIKAMNEYEKVNGNKGTATDGMILFCVLNTVPFQLIPSTLIAMRSRHGSENPFDIIVPIWISSLLINVFAVVVCKLLAKLYHRREVND